MLRVNVIGTGSSGNCYLLSDYAGNTLILDCGIDLSKVKQALNFDLSKIQGLFISHSHVDHAKYREHFERMGVEIMAPYDKAKIRENKKLGVFDIQAFQLPHGETVSYGALIRHVQTKDTVLYLTDFEYSPYVFKACKVNHYMIECNYQKNLLDLDAPNKEHKILGHCSLDTCKEFLKLNQTSEMQNVLLIHGGFTTCNPNECIASIESTLPATVIVEWAYNGKQYDFQNGIPFYSTESEE